MSTGRRNTKPSPNVSDPQSSASAVLSTSQINKSSNTGIAEENDTFSGKELQPPSSFGSVDLFLEDLEQSLSGKITEDLRTVRQPDTESLFENDRSDGGASPDRVRIGSVGLDDSVAELFDEDGVFKGPKAKRQRRTTGQQSWCGLHDERESSTAEKQMFVQRRRARALNPTGVCEATRLYPTNNNADDDETFNNWMAERMHRLSMMRILTNLAMGKNAGVWLREPSEEDEQTRCIINVGGKKFALIFEEEELIREGFIKPHNPQDPVETHQFIGHSSEMANEKESVEQIARYGDECRSKGYYGRTTEIYGRKERVRSEVLHHNSPRYYFQVFIKDLLEKMGRWVTKDPISAEPPPSLVSIEGLKAASDELMHNYVMRMGEFVGRLERAYNMAPYGLCGTERRTTYNCDGPRRRAVIRGVAANPAIAVPKRRPCKEAETLHTRIKRVSSVERMDSTPRLALMNEVVLPRSADRTIEARERRKMISDLFGEENYVEDHIAETEEHDLLLLGHLRINTAIASEDLYKCGNNVFCQDSQIDRRRGSVGFGDICIGPDGHYCVVDVRLDQPKHAVVVPMIHGATAEWVAGSSLKAVVVNQRPVFMTARHRYGKRGTKVFLRLGFADAKNSSGEVCSCYRGFVWVKLTDTHPNSELKDQYVCAHQDYVDIQSGRLAANELQATFGVPIAFGLSSTTPTIGRFAKVGMMLGLCVDTSATAASIVFQRTKKAVPVSLENVEGITSLNFCHSQFDGRIVDDYCDLRFLEIEVYDTDTETYERAVIEARLDDVFWLQQSSVFGEADIHFSIDINIDKIRIGVSESVYNSKEGWLIYMFGNKKNVQLYVSNHLKFNGEALGSTRMKGGIGLSNDEPKFRDCLAEEMKRLETCERVMDGNTTTILEDTDKAVLSMEVDMLRSLASKKEALLEAVDMIKF